MKVIDILNKIVNGTLKDGFKFKYKNAIWTYQNKIILDEGHNTFSGCYFVEEILNEQVEFVKGIEKLSETDYKNNTVIYSKINELIEVINEFQEKIDSLDEKIKDLKKEIR